MHMLSTHHLVVRVVLFLTPLLWVALLPLGSGSTEYYTQTSYLLSENRLHWCVHWYIPLMHSYLLGRHACDVSCRTRPTV